MNQTAFAALFSSGSVGAYAARFATLPLYAALTALYVSDTYRRKRGKYLTRGVHLIGWDDEDRDERLAMVREKYDMETQWLTWKRAYHFASPLLGKEHVPLHDGRQWRLFDNYAIPMALWLLPGGQPAALLCSFLFLPYDSFAYDDAELITDRMRQL